MGYQISGFLNVNKPRGITSHDVVLEIRKLIRGVKVGHGGTLDPNAEGVLPICIGKATKKTALLTSENKEYVGQMLLGVTTDTQDLCGKVLEKKEVGDITRQDIENVIQEFKGDIEQLPPMVSAKRYKGKRLYELAREGKTVERTPKKITVFSFDILDVDLPRVSFKVVCSKGTYVRSLCHEIGIKLKCGACLAELVRTRVGRFYLENSVSLDEIKDKAILVGMLLPWK